MNEAELHSLRRAIEEAEQEEKQAAERYKNASRRTREARRALAATLLLEPLANPGDFSTPVADAIALKGGDASRVIIVQGDPEA